MRLAIIGCNSMGRHHAQMATNIGFELVACADKHKEIAHNLAQAYRAEATDACLETCRRDDIDVVAITTPTPNHTEYVVAAAEAGKHIFCEKPFGRTIAQCDESIEAANKAGIKLFVGHVVRYFQEFEAIKAQVDAGKVGTPGFVRTYRGGIYPEGIDKWFRDYDMSGGVTLDCIIHDFDWLRYVFGDAERVFCQSLMRSEPEVLDYSLVTFRMKSGIICNTIGTWAHPAGFRVKVEVCGDKGMVTYDSAEAPIESMQRASAGGGPGMIIPGSPVATSPYQLEWEDFQRWLEHDTPPRVTPEDAREAVRMALGALESNATGKAVEL